jgi:hypothetical protein
MNVRKEYLDVLKIVRIPLAVLLVRVNQAIFLGKIKHLALVSLRSNDKSTHCMSNNTFCL